MDDWVANDCDWAAYYDAIHRQEIPGLEFQFIRPDEARPFIDSLSLKRLNYVLWDLPPVRDARSFEACGLSSWQAREKASMEREKRINTWLDLLKRSSEIAYWTWRGEPRGLLWALPLTIGADAFAVHFHFADKGRRLFPLMMAQYLETTAASCILGLLPASYKGVRGVIETFSPSRLLLPKACHIARLDKTVDGYLYYLEPELCRKRMRRDRIEFSRKICRQD